MSSQPWSDTDEQLTQLPQKVDDYLTFAADEADHGPFRSPMERRSAFSSLCRPTH